MPERVFKEPYKKLIVIVVALAVIISTVSAVLTITGIKYITEPAKAEEAFPLFVKIFVDKSSGTVPFAGNFTSIVLYYEGNVTYLWDFGDGNTSTEIKPSNTYGENGTYICNLTVTDRAGEEASDSILILASANQPPSVTILISEKKPSRPFIPLLPKLLRTDIYGARTLRQLIELKLIPSSLLNLKSDVHCEAQASDPEGDEIVSYTWILQPPTYITKLGKQVKPKYEFKGKSITFPLVYIFPTDTYDLTLIATDAAGNQGSDTMKFKVEESSIESQIGSIKQSINELEKFVKDTLWHDLLKDDLKDPVSIWITGRLFQSLKSPLLKLFIIMKLSGWALDLDTMEVIVELLEKHPVLRESIKKGLEGVQSRLEKMKEKFPKLEKNIDKLIDGIQELLKKLGLANLEPELSDEDPEHKSQFINPNYQNVSITVTDPEGDPFNISIYGDHVNDVFLTNQYNGTFNASLITPLPYETDIYWHVSVSDYQGRWVNETYKFTTFWRE